MKTKSRSWRWRGAATFLLAVTAAMAQSEDPSQDNTSEEPEVVSADDSRNPYWVFVDRNPFSLRDPPPPPPPVNTTPPSLLDIKLTGITSFGTTKAYLVVTEQGKKEAENYALAVNQEKDGIEILEIDPFSRSVRIRNGGSETVLTFATHGIAPAAGAPAPAPGTPGAPPVPGGAPGGAGAYAPATFNPAAGMTASPGVPPPPSNTTPFRTIPSRQLRGTGGGGTALGIPGGSDTPVSVGGGTYFPQPKAEPSNMQSEEQMIIMEINRALDPNLPPTPGIPVPSLPGQGP